VLWRAAAETDFIGVTDFKRRKCPFAVVGATGIREGEVLGPPHPDARISAKKNAERLSDSIENFARPRIVSDRIPLMLEEHLL